MTSGNTTKVAVIGFGYIGSVIGATLATRGCTVIGVDRDSTIVETVMSGRSPFVEDTLEERIAQGSRRGDPRVTTDASQVAGCDVYIITVGTPLSQTFEADTDHVQAAWSAIDPYVSDGSLVIVKSTVPPHTNRGRRGGGVCRQEHRRCLLPGTPRRRHAISEFESLPIIVGGVTERAGLAAKAFWESVLDVDVYGWSAARSSPRW